MKFVALFALAVAFLALPVMADADTGEGVPFSGPHQLGDLPGGVPLKPKIGCGVQPEDYEAVTGMKPNCNVFIVVAPMLTAE